MLTWRMSAKDRQGDGSQIQMSLEWKDYNSVTQKSASGDTFGQKIHDDDLLKPRGYSSDWLSR